MLSGRTEAETSEARREHPEMDYPDMKKTRYISVARESKTKRKQLTFEL